jgi:hypothetical protein
MGGRHSRLRPKRIAIAIAIPNFPYPPNILNFLLSQSSAYKITFVSPNGNTGTLPNSPPDPIETPFPDTTIPSPTTPVPSDTSDIPAANIIPAYSTTLAPQVTYGPTPTNPVNPPNPAAPFVLPANSPAIWVAAIQAMEFLNNLGPIDTQDKLKSLYSNLSSQLPVFMGDGTNGSKNASSLIYFCTITTVAFEPFQSKFTYNYLNRTYPQVFIDAYVYQKIAMLNIFNAQASKIFNYYSIIPGNGYVTLTDRVMNYVAPYIINAIIPIIKEENPLSEIVSM